MASSSLALKQICTANMSMALFGGCHGHNKAASCSFGR